MINKLDGLRNWFHATLNVIMITLYGFKLIQNWKNNQAYKIWYD